MDVRVVLLPNELSGLPAVPGGEIEPASLGGRAAAIFDVLRATTTMTAALSAGVKEIRVFGDVEIARAAAEQSGDPTRILCGEVRTLPPPGFDLGNSPGAFRPELHAGRSVYMSTTNGTRAIIAAKPAKLSVTAALVNASAVAKVLYRSGLPITLICSGTSGAVSMEDVLGCGVVIEALRLVSGDTVVLSHDPARIAHRLFLAHRDRLPEILSDGDGGHNIRRVGLDADIEFAARLDVYQTVGVVDWAGGQPVVRKADQNF